MLDKTRDTYLLLLIFTSLFNCTGIRLTLIAPVGSSGGGDDLPGSFTSSPPSKYSQMSDIFAYIPSGKICSFLSSLTHCLIASKVLIVYCLNLLRWSNTVNWCW